MLQNIDIHELNALMERDETAKRLITQMLTDHQMLISTISHEIRNPLTLVSSSLQLIESEHPEVKDFYGWTQTMEDVDFMRQLLEELSSFNNGSTVRPSCFSMEQLLKNIAISFAISLNEQESAIEFSSKIAPDLGDFVGDKLKLEEVLLNLLRNAKDAIEGAGSIFLSATRLEDSLQIEVKDTGCGIPDEHLQSIFEPFRTYKPNGTGLGLALSQQIITAHGGSLSVESQEGKGSTFSIILPIALLTTDYRPSV